MENMERHHTGDPLTRQETQENAASRHDPKTNFAGGYRTEVPLRSLCSFYLSRLCLGPESLIDFSGGQKSSDYPNETTDSNTSEVGRNQDQPRPPACTTEKSRPNPQHKGGQGKREDKTTCGAENHIGRQKTEPPEKAKRQADDHTKEPHWHDEEERHNFGSMNSNSIRTPGWEKDRRPGSESATPPSKTVFRKWWAVKDSNLRPTGYEPAALTT